MSSSSTRAGFFKCALTLDDVQRYSLPPNTTRLTDSRSAAFVAKYGDLSVELDALPASVLNQRLVEEIEAHMDMDVLAKVQETQEQEPTRLVELLTQAKKPTVTPPLLQR